MGLDITHMLKYVIDPTLQFLGLHSESARRLVLGTAIQESRLEYLHQLGGGPAVGLFQMEPATHNDIWENYLLYKKDFSANVGMLVNLRALGAKESPYPPADEMHGNLYYACAMCRIHYLRVPEGLPEPSDIKGMAEYWKEHYNTYLGAGTPEEYEENWRSATFRLDL